MNRKPLGGIEKTIRGIKCGLMADMVCEDGGMMGMKYNLILNEFDI